MQKVCRRSWASALRCSMADDTRQSPLPLTTMIGIVGAGAMGAGIAQVAAVAGHKVKLFDTRADAAQHAITGVVARIEKLAAKKRLTQEQATAVRGSISTVPSLAELADCGLIIEAIIENLAAKQELFRSLEAVIGHSALLATNTSSISVTSIASALQRPERLLGMHFFNPAPLMPLVEIISGLATDRAAAATLYATAKTWGKSPVYAKSTPGFIVNRVARPFYAEALRGLNEGAADCATIDAILREAGGFRMGAFELMDLIGHDVNYAVTRSVFDAFFGDPRFTPSLRQLELVEAGFLGRKSGRGFYTYDEDSTPATPQTLDRRGVPSQIQLFGDDDVANALAMRLNVNAVSFTHVASSADGCIAEADGAVLCVCDGRTANNRAHTSGRANTILLDWCLDPLTAFRIAISCADTCAPAAVDAATGLLQAAGFAVSRIDDVAGMVVLRTVAMLANEAADAVQQGVCSASDCDLAMRKGVNYPLGPLEWADKLGAATVFQALAHLHAAYGDARYRVSPLLHRRAITNTRFHEASRA